VLRGIFGPKRDEVTVEWRRLHNKERDALYSSPNIIRAIISRKMRWGENVACMGNRKGGAYIVWWGDLMERDPLGDLSVNKKIILKGFKKWDGEAWTGFFWFRIGTGGGCL
jgi:hypothetical protein